LYDSPQSWKNSIHPDDRDAVWNAALTKQVEGTYDEEYRIIRPDGQVRWIRDRAFPVRNAAGRVERVLGMAYDITEHRHLSEQLRQSQKMEAVGQLAGGVAHDFNNILTVIRGNAELSLMDAATSPVEARECIGQIIAAADRAANLTSQLLLFGRRQVMQPRDLDLNDVVTNVAKMLQRIIGEDVRLQLHLNPTSLPAHADEGMLDQVMLNLAVNARDAMPTGGTLIIETSEKVVDESIARMNPEALPGRYVCVSVADTGAGIPKEILPRIFEPFFTTKEPGKGTGLGLATVFGIVKQHHGWIKVYSEVGHGTEFQVFIPESRRSAAPEQKPVLQHKSKGGTETILLVEDEPSVRRLTRAVLERSGYQVFEAENGPHALEVWAERDEEIQLLLTDLVMPNGMSGHELARQLREYRSDLKVIFTSGYSAEMAGKQLELGMGERFLQKPYPPHELLQEIRQCLDEGF
jgi:signal transduction histidine kinase/CheY-like chemotaxis protein